MDTRIRVGVIANVHGVRGEVKVFPTTENPDRFGALKRVTAKQGEKETNLTVTGARPFKNMILMTFQEITNRDQGEALRNADLLIPREEAIPLEEGEFFLYDLIGIQVVLTSGEPLGILKEILQTGANDVYVVTKEDKKEILLPAISQCIKEVNLETGRMVVNLLPGLEESQR